MGHAPNIVVVLAGLLCSLVQCLEGFPAREEGEGGKQRRGVEGGGGKEREGKRGRRGRRDNISSYFIVAYSTTKADLWPATHK